jgi:hypothetical protein
MITFNLTKSCLNIIGCLLNLLKIDSVFNKYQDVYLKIDSIFNKYQDKQFTNGTWN